MEISAVHKAQCKAMFYVLGYVDEGPRSQIGEVFNTVTEIYNTAETV